MIFRDFCDFFQLLEIMKTKIFIKKTKIFIAEMVGWAIAQLYCKGWKNCIVSKVVLQPKEKRKSYCKAGVVLQ